MSRRMHNLHTFYELYSQVANLLLVTIASRLSLVAADLLVVVMTWSPTYERAMEVRAALGKRRATLSWVLFRDGLIYFMCVPPLN